MPQVKRKRTEGVNMPNKKQKKSSTQWKKLPVPFKKGPEVKCSDYSPGTADMTNVGTVIPLTNINQGSDIDERIGFKIQAKSVFIRMNIKAAVIAPGFARLILFQDLRQENGTTPTQTQLLEVLNAHSPVAQENRDRFRILREDVLPINSYNGQNYCLKYFANLGNEIGYSGTTGGSINKNGVYLFIYSTYSSGYPTVDYYSRISFTDF